MVGSTEPNIINQIASYTKNREAIPSFTGYLYQFELVLLHILEDGSTSDAFDDPREGDKGTYYIEKIEDYLKYYSSNRINYIKLAQIKYHAGYAGPSEYQEAVLWLYYNFLLYNKHSTDPNEEIHFTVFHHDLSPDNKKPNEIFSDGLSKNAAETSEKQNKAYKKILELEMGGVGTSLRAEFTKVLKFKKTKDRSEIIKTVQDLLVEKYSSHRREYTDGEFVYGAALSFLMDRALEGESITQSELDDYFINKTVNVNIKFYLYKIFCILEEVSNSIMQAIKSPRIPIFKSQSLAEEDISLYELIIRKIVKYLRAKFYDEKKRRSFLNTIISINYNYDYLSNSEEEYELFLSNKDSIQAFIMKLSKIMYYHHIEEKGIVILNKWFRITSEIWLFSYPDEQRMNGAILGRTAIDGMASLGDLIHRFVNFDNKPGIWYMKLGEEEENHIRASNTFYYQHDITQIDVEPTPCYPQDIFYIQCLSCLGITRYSDTKQVKNIFTNGCVRGD